MYPQPYGHRHSHCPEFEPFGSWTKVTYNVTTQVELVDSPGATVNITEIFN
jgi:hypothetical protein